VRWSNSVKPGHQVTNAHVINGSTDVKVTLFDQTTYRAKVRGVVER
jgi:S1-C subfamily serine protease